MLDTESYHTASTLRLLGILSDGWYKQFPKSTECTYTSNRKYFSDALPRPPLRQALTSTVSSGFKSVVLFAPKTVAPPWLATLSSIENQRTALSLRFRTVYFAQSRVAYSSLETESSISCKSTETISIGESGCGISEKALIAIDRCHCKVRQRAQVARCHLVL